MPRRTMLMVGGGPRSGAWPDVTGAPKAAMPPSTGVDGVSGRDCASASHTAPLSVCSH